MTSIRSTMATVWRIASPYFRSEDKWIARGLLAAVIAIELAVVAVTVLFNRWNNDFYNSLQERNLDQFTSLIMYFGLLAALFIGLRVYQLYLNQWLQIRWRRWMTDQYLKRWMTDANHYRMQLHGDAADNPDQRIAEDTRQFIENTLSIGIGFLSAVTTLASFVVILWHLSSQAPLRLFGSDVSIPGYLVWAALIYAVIGTILTHLIGSPLARLNFAQQKNEADFRYSLVRARENAEQIALLKGEPTERAQFGHRFGFIYDNWLAIMSRTKKLTAFTATYNQISIIFPYVTVAPAYFSGKMQLGGMMQTASAFASVQESLSFFVTAYRTLAEWRACITRLDGFDTAIATSSKQAPRDAISLHTNDARMVRLEDVEIARPDGKALITANEVVFAPSTRTLLSGPSGSGKTTLFRAIAGIWPFGRGKVTRPENANIMMLPQRPYFPVGSLREAIAYPRPAESFADEDIRTALIDAGLHQLSARLDQSDHWNRRLSIGEQQRLSIARTLLHKPDILFLDEATASLDEASEERLYRLLTERLPSAMIVSIGHRSTLKQLHDQTMTLEQHGDHFAMPATPRTV